MSLIDDLLITIDDKSGITKEELLAISENPNQKTALFSALARLKSKFFVDQISNGFKISQLGKQRINYYLDTLQRFRKNNKKWWLLLIEIPEPQRLLREKLRYELKKIGVGVVKRGVYIVHDEDCRLVEAVLNQNNLFAKAILLQINYYDNSAVKKITGLAWDWRELNDNYTDYINKYKNFFDKSKYLSGDIRRIEAKKAVFAFAKLLSRDPRVIDQLTPQRYLRPNAYILYEKIRPYCYD